MSLSVERMKDALFRPAPARAKAADKIDNVLVSVCVCGQFWNTDGSPDQKAERRARDRCWEHEFGGVMIAVISLIPVQVSRLKSSCRCARLPRRIPSKGYDHPREGGKQESRSNKALRW